MAPSPTQLDHVVLLLPHKDVLQPPEWITRNFKVCPGGRHEDGKTENRLVMFRDGTYLELIAFIDDDPEKRKGHWWDKEFGIVDFALTTKAPFDHQALQSRLKDAGSEISYAEPREGGRVTAGKERHQLKWKVTFPENVPRGMVPFWCHDVTPREQRVPALNGNTHHPGGCVGVEGMVLEVPDDRFEDVDKALSAITQARLGPDKFHVSTPFLVGRPQEPTIVLKRLGKDGPQEPHLTLLMHSPGRDGIEAIQEKVGNGRVSIIFEK